MKINRAKWHSILERSALIAFPLLSILGIFYVTRIVPYIFWKISFIAPFIWAIAALYLLFSEKEKDKAEPKKYSKVFMVVCAIYFAVLLVASFVRQYTK